LEEKLSSQGLHVLGFSSDDFGAQGGSRDQTDACSEKYAVTFQQFAQDHVVDPDGAGPASAQPVWAWLETQANPGPSSSSVPTWNFHKYLVSREGQLVAHWDSAVYPGDDPSDPNDSFETSAIVAAIEAELAKP
jgi:glutathione peroxidase